jgi:uncharacterized protein
MKFVGLVFSWFLFLTLAAFADDTATFNAMLALANKGDAEAQYHVGMMYNNGIGTAQDPKQAFGWFEKSTASHDPLGAFKLGCYYAGQFAGVVETNPDEALKYKLIAAKAGYSLAQHDVAVHYSRQGNAEEAVKWLKLAAAQGYDSSFYGLASSYHEGRGVPKDIPLAFVNFKLALMTSQTELTDSNKAVLDEMIAQMSTADLEKAQKMVADWKPEPTPLTIKAMGGISEAEAYLQRAKQ